MFDFGFVFCGLLNFYSFERSISLFTINATVISMEMESQTGERHENGMAHVQMHTHLHIHDK